MIYDCFLFNGEMKCLNLRQKELQELNVTHVVVQQTKTFVGNVNNNLWWFTDTPPTDKWYYIYVTDMPENATAWERETYQRNAIMKGLVDAKDDDIIIISDADEIPRAEAVKKYKPEMGLTALKMDNFWYKFNCLTERQTWVAPRIMTYKYLKNTTPNSVRLSGYENVIDNGGWHFSYCGNADYIANKLKSFSHEEYNVEPYNNKEYIKKQIESGISLWGDSQFEFVPMDETFPKFLVDNQEYFKELIQKV